MLLCLWLSVREATMLIIDWTPKHTADTKVYQTSGPHRAFYRELNI